MGRRHVRGPLPTALNLRLLLALRWPGARGVLPGIPSARHLEAAPAFRGTNETPPARRQEYYGAFGCRHFGLVLVVTVVRW